MVTWLWTLRSRFSSWDHIVSYPCPWALMPSVVLNQAYSQGISLPTAASFLSPLCWKHPVAVFWILVVVGKSCEAVQAVLNFVVFSQLEGINACSHSKGNQLKAWLTLSTEHDAPLDSRLAWAGWNWLASGSLTSYLSLLLPVWLYLGASCFL